MPVIAPSNGVAQGDDGLEIVRVTNSCMTALTDRGVLITSAAVIDMITAAVSRAEILLRFIKFELAVFMLTLDSLCADMERPGRIL